MTNTSNIPALVNALRDACWRDTSIEMVSPEGRSLRARYHGWDMLHVDVRIGIGDVWARIGSVRTEYVRSERRDAYEPIVVPPRVSSCEWVGMPAADVTSEAQGVAALAHFWDRYCACEEASTAPEAWTDASDLTGDL